MIIYPFNSESIAEIKWKSPNHILIQYRSGDQFYTYESSPEYFNELNDYSNANNGKGINRKIKEDMNTKIFKIGNPCDW